MWLRICFAAFLVLYGFHAFARQNLVDQDLWGHLAFGRAIWCSGEVLRLDPYAYVPTRPWVNHEWLSEVLYYLVLAAFSSVGLLLIKALAGGLAALHAGFAAGRRLEAFLPTALVALLALHGIGPDVFVRPYVFTYLFFAVTLYTLETASEDRPRALWLLPLVMGVWANCHAGFVAGLGAIVIYVGGALLDRRWRLARRLGVVLALSTLVTLINPYGIRYWPFVLHAVTMQRPYITEWRPVPWGIYDRVPIGGVTIPIPLFFEFKILLALAAAAVAAALWAGRRSGRDAVAYALLGVTAWMALGHYRHVPMFLLAAMVYLPFLGVRAVADLRRRPDAFAWAARWDRIGMPILALVAAGLVLAGAGRMNRGLQVPLRPKRTSYVFPVNAVRFMRANHLEGRTLVFFDWGEFLIWEMWPSCKVSFDGRLETVYPPAVIHENLDFTFGRPAGWKLAADYPPDLMLLRRPAARVAVAHGWRVAYMDPNSVLLVPPGTRRAWRRPPPIEDAFLPMDRWLGMSPWEGRPVP